MPGLIESVYLGGVNIARGPGSFQPVRQYARTDQRLRGGTLVTHKAKPSAGDPDLIWKWKWTLVWARLTDDDDEAIAQLVGEGASFDFCPWQRVSEAWTFAAGASYSGNLLRRNAVDVIASEDLPQNAASRYAMSGTLNGTAKTITLGSTTSFRTAWTATGSATAGDLIHVRYWPVYRAKATEDEESYQLPHIKGWRLVLEEI